MAKTGTLSPEQLEVLKYPYAYFEVTTNNNGSYHYPKVYENDTLATFMCTKIVTVEGVDRYATPYFKVNKETGDWVYVETGESSSAGDDYLIKLNGDNELTIDVTNVRTELTGSATKDGYFITGNDTYEMIKKLVPNTRTVNSKALSSDVTLTNSNFTNAVPSSRTINSVGLGDDVEFVLTSGENVVYDFWKVNGKSLTSDIDLSFSDLRSYTTIRYQHNIRIKPSSSSSNVLYFQFYNTTSSAYDKVSDVANAVYSAGFKNDSTYLSATGYEVQCVYASNSSTLKWGGHTWYTMPSSATVSDVVLTVY